MRDQLTNNESLEKSLSLQGLLKDFVLGRPVGVADLMDANKSKKILEDFKQFVASKFGGERGVYDLYRINPNQDSLEPVLEVLKQTIPVIYNFNEENKAQAKTDEAAPEDVAMRDVKIGINAQEWGVLRLFLEEQFRSVEENKYEKHAPDDKNLILEFRDALRSMNTNQLTEVLKKIENAIKGSHPASEHIKKEIEIAVRDTERKTMEMTGENFLPDSKERSVGSIEKKGGKSSLLTVKLATIVGVVGLLGSTIGWNMYLPKRLEKRLIEKSEEKYNRKFSPTEQDSVKGRYYYWQSNVPKYDAQLFLEEPDDQKISEFWEWSEEHPDAKIKAEK